MQSKERYFQVKKLSEAMRSFINRISEKTKLNQKMLAVVFLLLTGAALLLISEMPKEEKNVSAEASTEQETTDVSKYERKLEERLVSIISAIEGAGETRVMVTLESGSEEVYLNNSDYGENIGVSGKNSFESKDDYVIVEGTSGQNGIVVRVAQPKVRGVAVVCKGAGNENVKIQIVEAVTALLDISSARVSVAKMN